MWRDERAISNILEEMIALAVISVALCLLLTSMSNRVANEIDAQETIEMGREARRLIERVISHPRLIKNGERLLLDQTFLGNASVDGLREVLQTSYAFRLIVHDVSSSADYAFQTSDPVGHVASATTSCNIWVDSREVHAARLTIVIWR